MSEDAPPMDPPSQDGPLPREDMISKAVEFLLHPKVQTSTLTQRRAFLAKKGLSPAEVSEAIHRSGLQEADGAALAKIQPSANMALATVESAAPVTVMSRAKDFGVLMLVLGGVSYGIYQLLEKYILPAWVGASEEQKSLKEMKKSVSDLEKTVKLLIEGMKKVEGTLTDQENNVRQMVNSAAQERGSDALQKVNEANNFKEIKAEITSLKGLLLSRNQFPKTPCTQPLIPSWQLASSPETDEAHSEAKAETKSSVSHSTSQENDLSLMNGDVNSTDVAAAQKSSSFELLSPSEEPAAATSSGLTDAAQTTMET